MQEVIKLTLQNIFSSIDSMDGTYDQSCFFGPLHEIGELCLKEVSKSSEDPSRLPQYINFQRIRFLSELFEEFDKIANSLHFSNDKRYVINIIRNDIIAVINEEKSVFEKYKNSD